jgi:hypothetical protein
MSTAAAKHKLGDLRPSQLLLTLGVGSIVDLPNLSVMIMGLDDCTGKVVRSRFSSPQPTD